MIAVRTRPGARDAEAKEATLPGNRWDLRASVGLVCLATLGQIFLGGMVRHSMAGLACVTIPDCFGSYWPPDSESAYSERLHMLHRPRIQNPGAVKRTADRALPGPSVRYRWTMFTA